MERHRHRVCLLNQQRDERLVHSASGGERADDYSGRTTGAGVENRAYHDGHLVFAAVHEVAAPRPHQQVHRNRADLEHALEQGEAGGNPVRLPEIAELESVGAGSNGLFRLWSVGTLANGDSATMTIVINAAQAGTYVNTAVILGSDAADPNPSNQQSTVTVQVAGADIAVGKTVDVTRPVQGSVVTYTVTVRNLGPDGTTGVVVNDPLPAGVDFISATPSQGTYSATTGAWAVGTMASLAEETLTIKVRPTATGSITNTATVAPNPAVPDPEPANNQASATIDVQPGAPDLAVSKSVSTGTVKIGQNFSFRLSVKNIGVGTANNVVLTDKVPTAARPVSAPGCAISGQVVRCRIAALAPHTGAAFTVTVQAVTAGRFTNTVIVTSANTDPIHQNNTASSGVQVLGEEFTSPPPTPTPTPSPSATTPEPVSEPSGSGDLPTTGGPILALTVAGLVLLGVGTLLTSARRRRRRA